MRRLPARHVFVFSLMAALACLVLAVWLGMNRTPWHAKRIQCKT